MQINPISKVDVTLKQSVQDKTNVSAGQQGTVEKSLCEKIPALCYKANYCPSFGKYKKVCDVQLKERKTGRIVTASVKREKVGDFLNYKMYVDKNEVGFMYMNCDSYIPEGNFVVTQPTNNIPEITHIRSIEGNKYEGIGTTLINAAVAESIKRGKDGCLWLKTEKGYARTFSKYRSDENPIPFYYKLGFRAPEKKVDDLIRYCLDRQDYSSLPNSALLLLTPEAISAKNKYFANNYVFLN